MTSYHETQFPPSSFGKPSVATVWDCRFDSTPRASRSDAYASSNPPSRGRLERLERVLVLARGRAGSGGRAGISAERIAVTPPGWTATVPSGGGARGAVPRGSPAAACCTPARSSRAEPGAALRGPRAAARLCVTAPASSWRGRGLEMRGAAGPDPRRRAPRARRLGWGTCRTPSSRASTEAPRTLRLPVALRRLRPSGAGGHGQRHSGRLLGHPALRELTDGAAFRSGPENPTLWRRRSRACSRTRTFVPGSRGRDWRARTVQLGALRRRNRRRLRRAAAG